VATFYNKYSDLVGNSLGQAFFENGPPSRLVIPLVAQNNVEGETYGSELSARWLPRPWLRLATSYSLLKMDLRDKAPVLVPTAGVVEGQSPQHQLYTSVSADLTKKLRMDSDLSFRDRLRFGNVAGYTVLDSKLTWHPRQIDFSVGGKNLLNKQHLEFVSTQDGFSTVLGRTVYGRATWHF
jgi:outer membrane receptor protein involved in Fe transport